MYIKLRANVMFALFIGNGIHAVVNFTYLLNIYIYKIFPKEFNLHYRVMSLYFFNFLLLFFLTFTPNQV
jgi:hypothetical protein